MRLPIWMALLATMPAFAQKRQTVTSNVDKVTVFLSGAQVTRSATTSLPAGTTTLVFQQVSPQLEQRSIQVQGQGDFTILSVSRELNLLKTQQKQEKVQQLETEIQVLEEKLNRERNALAVYRHEEEMLNKNQDIRSTQNGVKTADLREALDFHRARLAEVLDKQAQAAKAVLVTEKELKTMQQQLVLVNNQHTQATTDLLVTISSKENINGRFTLSYLVKNAGWYPQYDLRVKDIKHPMELVYKANVYQSSGEEWKNVKLSLSTGNPSENGTKPTLQPWYLRASTPDYQQLNDVVVVGYGAAKRIRGVATMEVAAAPVKAEFKEAEAPTVAVSYSATTINFDIANPYTIESDGKPNTVAIKEQEVPALYQYYAAPKLDKSAYLIARITGWESLNLLEGETSIYFEGMYVGKSQLGLQHAGDTLQVSLGKDKNITVNRTLQKDYSQRQFIGNYKTDTRNWEISVRNSKRDAVSIVLQDQLPVTTTKDIEINRVEVEGAQQDEITGLLTWKLEVEPGKEVKKHLKYAVKYPKAQVINLD
ncbi:mucoidy inhibitor MuiA family protein [Chitinophaga horti]|uniref:Mucoidy inhibitor MuiA family protein n=1 Tax=Chitinophaga horti TaxID=2920382 RepID=A0ABY6J004_9BACT|nr:mucoidy inhibitor MuiA family protein [Chitinophaga horti]UYQ91649.1 mucoidy inhibitor MuiA family protein [Chitinophaga horti]